MVSLVLADDHHLVRQGLRSLLEVEPDFQVIGEAADGLKTIQIVEDRHPDVLVLDLMMGGLSGLEVARQVSKRSPHTNIVILSMYSNEAYVLEALRAGAKAYILKESTGTELVRGIREALVGRHYLSPPLSEHNIGAYVEKTKDVTLDPYDTLTTREREVLHLAAHSYTNTKIATRLCISRRTVEFHRANVMRKLGLHNQSDLIRFGFEKGILPPSSPLVKSS